MRKLIFITGAQGAGKTLLTESFSDSKVFELNEKTIIQKGNYLRGIPNIIFTMQGDSVQIEEKRIELKKLATDLFYVFIHIELKNQIF